MPHDIFGMREVSGGSELERQNRLACLQKSPPGFCKLVGRARKPVEAAHETIVEKPERRGSEFRARARSSASPPSALTRPPEAFTGARRSSSPGGTGRTPRPPAAPDANQVAAAAWMSPRLKTVSAPATRRGSSALASRAHLTASAEPSGAGCRAYRIERPNPEPSPRRLSTCSARCPTTTVTSERPAARSSSRRVAITGRPSIGRIGFGQCSVNGRSRRPSPAANTTPRSTTT